MRCCGVDQQTVGIGKQIPQNSAEQRLVKYKQPKNTVFVNRKSQIIRMKQKITQPIKCKNNHAEKEKLPYHSQGIFQKPPAAVFRVFFYMPCGEIAGNHKKYGNTTAPQDRFYIIKFVSEAFCRHMSHDNSEAGQTLDRVN